MLVNTIGKADNKKIIMLPGSFCNSKSMAGLYNILKDDYYIILPEYSGHYENSTFTTRKQEALYITEYLESNHIKVVDMIYGQSMGAEIGIELLYQLTDRGIKVSHASISRIYRILQGGVCGGMWLLFCRIQCCFPILSKTI